MRVIVPFAAKTPKTRLSPVLTASERTTLARAMLADVLTATVEAGHEPTVVSTGPLEIGSDGDGTGSDSARTDALELADDVAPAVSVAVDDRSLTEAVNARLAADDEPVAVVMADLALATPVTLERLFEPDADVTVAPGRGGGTNALVVRHPDFRVDYHGASYLDHCEIARTVGAALETVDSFRLATDVDEPTDLVEVLVHGADEARTPATVREFGFELEMRGGRVAVGRGEKYSSH